MEVNKLKTHPALYRWTPEGDSNGQLVWVNPGVRSTEGTPRVSGYVICKAGLKHVSPSIEKLTTASPEDERTFVDLVRQGPYSDLRADILRQIRRHSSAHTQVPAFLAFAPASA